MDSRTRNIALACSLFSLMSQAQSAQAAVPGEVGAIRLTRDGKVQWPTTPGATAYNIYFGTAPRLRDQVCRIEGNLTTNADLPEQPVPGGLLYYLVTAVNLEGEGELGFDDGTPVANARPCNNDTDADGVRDAIDNCRTVPNTDQADQNQDAIGDRCDPKTYDFEADTAGSRPLEMTQVGGVNTTFTVRDLGGDLAASYNAPGIGLYDRFDRLEAAMQQADTTVYLDYELVAEVCSLELWSDGSYSWNAGTGLILQISAGGDLVLYERSGAAVPSVVGPTVPATGRIRLRLLKGFASESTLHVDAWDGVQWQDDLWVTTIADDRRYRGLSTAAGDYLGARRAIRRITVEHSVTPPVAGPLVIRKDHSWSSDWKLFQRDAGNLATIPVRFFYALSNPGRVRARVVWSATRAAVPGHNWNDHQMALPAAANGAGEIAVTGVPVGGNYDIEIELIDDTTPTTAIASGFLASVAVGDVWVSGGQSNMSGYSGVLAPAETPIDEVHLFHNDYTWRRASEPMDDGAGQMDRVSAEAPLHSLMLRFAKDLYRATGVPVAIIPGSLGGTNLYSQWQRDPLAPANRGTLYGSLLHRVRIQGYPEPVTGFLWFQGESDALALRTVTQYRTDLEQLLAQYRADLAAPAMFFINAQLGTFSGASLPDWLAIQEAERQAEATISRSALVPVVDQPRSDSIHFSVDAYKRIGARFAEVAQEFVHGQPVDAQARLVSATRLAAGDQVRLDYDAAVTGGAAALFTVDDTLGAALVTMVSASGSSVLLTLDRALSGAASVTYGWSVDPAAAWVKGPRGNAVACFLKIDIP